MAIQAELIDRFGALPPEAVNLIDVTQIKLVGTALGIERIRISRRGAVLEFSAGRSLSPGQCAILSETFGRGLLFKSGKTFSLSIEPDILDRVTGARDGGDPGNIRDGRGIAVLKKLLKIAYGSDKKGNSYSHKKPGTLPR
jgi:hypothetical protein